MIILVKYKAVLIQYCLCVWGDQGSRRSDEDVLEEHVRKLGEELREIQDLYEQEQERVRSTQEDMLQLHNQVHIKYTHLLFLTTSALLTFLIIPDALFVVGVS